MLPPVAVYLTLDIFGKGKHVLPSFANKVVFKEQFEAPSGLGTAEKKNNNELRIINVKHIVAILMRMTLYLSDKVQYLQLHMYELPRRLEQ